MNIDQLQVRHIRKKNKIRKIVTYKTDNNTRKLHEKINEFIVDNTRPSIFSKAYIKNRSIITNARAHMYNDIFVLNDIKDYFNSINLNKLIEILNYELNKDKAIIEKKDIKILVEACSVNNKGLPLGLVTSPMLSNLYLKEFDNVLYGKLKKMNLDNVIYTRYADDMIISYKSKDLDYEIIHEINGLIINRLKYYGLKVNDRKSRVIDLNKSNHVKITGINITKSVDNYRKLTVGQDYKNELYWGMINMVESGTIDKIELRRLKGIESFILSVEGLDYEVSYSTNMIKVIKDKGFESLHNLIKHM